MSTPRQLEAKWVSSCTMYSYPHFCPTNGEGHEGVAAPLEPTAPEIAGLRQWEIDTGKPASCSEGNAYMDGFRDGKNHAAAASKNLQEERDQFSKMAHNLRKIAEEKTLLVHECGGKLNKAEARISELEKEIAALRETK